MDVYAKNGIIPLPVIKTERLELRPMALTDADQVADKLNNLAISKWLTVVPYPYTQADAVWFINENLAGRAASWSIFLGDDLIGNIGIDGELGYWLSEDAWGQGFATEAGQAAVAHNFSDRSVDLIISSHFTENAGSQNVLEKLGFVDVGSHVHHSVARGADVPGRSMELTRLRWESLQNA